MITENHSHRRKTVGVLLVVLPAILWPGACRKSRSSSSRPLLCYVGGTMRPAMEEIARLYEQRTGQKVNIDYAGSGELLIKIQATGKGDLYVCHDPFLAALMRRGLGDRAWVVASLRPMIAVKRGNPKGIHGLADLARPGLRVGVTHLKYSTTGHIAQICLGRSGLGEKIRANVQTEMRQGGAAANAVAVGTLDAAIVWDAVIFARRKDLEAVPIEEAWMPQRDVDTVTTATYGPIEMDYVRVVVATLKCSTQPERARAFAEFAASPAGQRVFARHGFSPADPTRRSPPGRAAGVAGATAPAGQVVVPALEGSIFVHCGAAMRKPVSALAAEFTRRTGVKVQTNFGGSNVLLGQIELTRKGDVYIPGDADYVDEARRKGLAGYDRTICYFVPVIMVARGNPRGVRSLTDLTRPGLRVGLGDERACAVGRLIPELLRRNRIDPKAVEPNVVLRTPTVNELAMKVKLRTVDAVIVWSSIAAQYAKDSARVPIPAERNVIPRVAAAVLTTARNPVAARAFVEFLAGERGRAVFKQNHYSVDRPK